ncbi:MAG: hypothetical protein ACI8ZB_001178 [Desulforhopalus sp.]|jgi:hypothetical protein
MYKLLDRNLFLEAILGSLVLSAIAFSIQSSYGFSWSDEGLLWYASQRTYLGELAIRDFFAYDPGRYYWNSIFFLIFSDTGLNTLLIAASSFGAFGLAITWYTMGMAKVNVKWRFCFAILITIALGYPRHKVYEQSLSLILVAVLFMVLTNSSSSRRWFVFGLATGVAAIFGRNHGVFFVGSAVLCGGYLLATKRANILPRVIVWYLLGVGLGYLPVISLFIFDSGFREAFWQSILFTGNWQLPLPIPFFWTIDYSAPLTYKFIHSLAIGFTCIVIPAIYFTGLLFFVSRDVFSREERSPAFYLLGASSIAGIPYLHQAFNRADFGHIAQATVPVFVAIAAIYLLQSKKNRNQIIIHIILFVSLVILLCAWIPSQPILRSIRMEILHPGATKYFSIYGKNFVIRKSQSTLLDQVKKIAEHCEISDGQFLAAPHFPGIYAYLGLKAPFWEMYYLYQRSPEFQKKHVDAISDVRLILLAAGATVDGLERLRLKNTYGVLLDHILNNYRKLNVSGLPKGVALYVDPRSCDVN